MNFDSHFRSGSSLLTTLQHVPIPMCEFICRKGCCQRTFCPLELAYARTIHRFQGLQAGPVDAGKPKNVHQHIICDPDEKQFEGSALGLMHTAGSRATTLGDDNGIGSAMHFTGNLKDSRIRNLTCKENTLHEFELAKKRRHWVNHLQKKARLSQPQVVSATSNLPFLIHWCMNNPQTCETLRARTQQCATVLNTKT